MIAISLSPNARRQDILLALKQIVMPWRYLSGGSIKSLESWFRNYFGVSFAISFNSGRSSLYAILKTLGIGDGDEVIVQAFTCVAVPNSVLWTGAKPIYADIDQSLTIDPVSFEERITPKTKAIVVQHTFAIPADMERITKIAKAKNIFVIEDCAHGIGATIRNKKLGTFGIASFFSFGRDKAFSSVFGGMVVTNDKEMGQKLRNFQKTLKYPNFFWTFQQLFHPIAFSFILPLYSISIGKALLVVLQKLHLLSFPVSSTEKSGKSKPNFIRKLPNALASLALNQLRSIEEFNAKREVISGQYVQELLDTQYVLPSKKIIPYLRFPIFTEKRDELLFLLKKQNIYLGKWYADVIDPKGVDFAKVFYHRGSCPNAELASQQILNLPTYPNMTLSDAKNIIQLLKSYA